MGSGSASAQDPFNVFMRLVGIGLSHFRDGDPAVLLETAPEEAYFPPEQGWPVVSTPSATLQTKLSELSMKGPVLVVPSWGRGTSMPPERGSRPPRFRYEDTLRTIRPADMDSVVAVLLPAAALWSETPPAVATREALANHWDMVAVVYGHGVLPQADRSLAVAVVILRGRERPTPPLRIYRVTRGAELSTVEADFQRLLKLGGGRVKSGYVLRDVPEAGVSLEFDRHDPAVLARKEGLAGFGGVTPLGDLCTFPRTLSLHEAKAAGWLCEVGDVAATRVLSGRDIGRAGLIAPPGEETVWAKVPEQFQLAEGDLVVRGVYGPGDSSGLVVAVVTQEDLPAAAMHTSIVLRPNAALAPRQGEFALMFLRTPLARTLLGTTGAHVSRAALASLPIPHPDKDLAEALDDLAAAKERLHAWHTQADDLLQSVFLDETPAAARARLIESGRDLRLKVEAAAMLDDFGYTVRTRFPYPVAARWRETEVLQSAGPSAQAYGAVLDTAEILLCLAALLALALSRAEGIKLGAVQAIKEKLQGGRNGPGMGDWAAVLRETATTKKLRSLPTTHPLNDLRGLLANTEAEAARQRLSDRRNNQAHLRHVDQMELPIAIHDAFEDLKVLLDAARFLTDWPLIQVTDVRWDSLTQTARFEYRELMGDHPVVPTQAETYPDSNLETGSLYLRGYERRLHLLRPFLIGRDCPRCRTWSTFHVDTAPKGTVVLKSLEHGHTLDEPTLTEAVQVVGLL